MSVCASDGKDYWNECFFNNARCLNSTLKILFSGGPCESEIFFMLKIILSSHFTIPSAMCLFLSIHCKWKKKIKYLFLLCPHQKCFLEQQPNFLQMIFSIDPFTPFRGSDGRMYLNKARLEIEKCTTKRFIQAVDIPFIRGKMWKSSFFQISYFIYLFITLTYLPRIVSSVV